jgi:hypothetical protein
MLVGCTRANERRLAQQAAYLLLHLWRCVHCGLRIILMALESIVHAPAADLRSTPRAPARLSILRRLKEIMSASGRL